MRFHLAMLDVDGTLKREAAWMPGARELLGALHSAGIAVALCSGREIASLQVTGDECPEVSLLAGGGGAIVKRRDGDGWVLVGQRFLDRALVDEVARRSADLGMEVWAYTDERWLVRERTARVEFDESFTGAHARRGEFGGRDDVIKLLLFCENPVQEAFRDELSVRTGLGVASSYPGYWDVLPAAALAGKGGDLLTAAVGCTWSETIAVGDGSNDLGMLSQAGLAYLLEPRRSTELAPGPGERVEVGEISDVLADLRRRRILPGG